MKFKITLLFIAFITFCNAQVVTIPDVNFKNALLSSLCVDADLNGTYESDADLNNDGQIQTSEASVIQRLKISYKSIADLTGIQNFTNLKKIVCDNNLLTTVDFSSNLNLQQIDCQSNRFVSLTINGLPLLSSLNIYPNSSLQNLTVTNNPSLTTLTMSSTWGALTSLVNLNCSHNGLTGLSLYNYDYPFVNLTHVDCSYNQLTSISLNPAIIALNASNNVITNFTLTNPNITSIDVSNNSLTNLSVYNCYNLATLIFNGNPSLNTLGVNNTNLLNLSVHGLANLQNLNCDFNNSYGGTRLNTLEIYDLPSLTNLNCYNNSISNLNISNFPSLTTINHSNNPNINLNLSNLPLITTYSADSGNSITVNSMPNLTGLTFENSFNNISISNNPLLNTINFSQISIGQFDITNSAGLTNFNFSCPQTTPYNLSIASLPNLTAIVLDIRDNCNLNLTNLPLLHQIDIKGVSSFNFHDLPQLYTIKSERGSLASFVIANLPNLHELLLRENYLTSLNLQNLPNLYSVNVYRNSITSISLVNLPLLHDVNFSYNLSSQTNYTYNFSNLPDLYSLNFDRTAVASIILNNLPDFHDFYLDSNSKITSLNFSNLPSLYDIEIMQCSNLGTVTFDNLNALYKLRIYNTKIQALSLINFPNLYDLEISSNRYVLNNNIVLTDLPSLFKLNLSSNELTGFTFNSLPSLSNLNLSLNKLRTINLSNLPNLSALNINGGNNTYLQALDLSSNPNISQIDYSTGWYYDQLKYINLRNGSNSLTSINVGTSVTNICVDDAAEKTHLQSLDSSLTNTIFTTYCSFNPTGTFYTLQGNSLLDTNNNGCDSNDIIFPMINFNINNGTITNSYFANNTGSYSIPLTAGQYSITPLFENPSYYTFSPSYINVDFPTQSSPLVQNFCITPNGNHNDLEITILPLVPARPGFDATYKLVFKNKGNQVQSGNINLIFNDAALDFVSTTGALSGQSANLLNWSFTNLQPFETKTIDVIFNVNSPSETPPVVSGTVLNFNAEIIGLTDENANDNISNLNQSVVNAFDPNDKTCLEGQIVSSNLIGEYVHYMIRFQNTGTSNAQNIVVKDIIDLTKFNIATLIPTSSSHSFYTKITNSNQVEFIFQDINLPYTSGNNNGYIAFKIKTKPNLVAGDTFSNKVDIYFDYNNPIVTNNYVSTIQTLGINETDLKNKLSIFPNPVKDILFFKTEEIVSKIEIYDIAGRILRSVVINENKVDLSELKSGNYFLKIYTERAIMNAKIIKE